LTPRTHDDDDADAINFLDADDHALALHEAGHAVVLHALGAKVTFVQLKMKTADGLTGCSEKIADVAKNLAVLLAGVGAELVFAKPRLRETLEGDFRQIRELLIRLSASQRRVALAEARRLVETTLRANEDVVQQIADALLDRGRWIGEDHLVRIEGEELVALLAGGSDRAAHAAACPAPT
jgi:hypothetical protein